MLCNQTSHQLFSSHALTSSLEPDLSLKPASPAPCFQTSLSSVTKSSFSRAITFLYWSITFGLRSSCREGCMFPFNQVVFVCFAFEQSILKSRRRESCSQIIIPPFSASFL